jgi:hypothetical protein
VHHSLAEHLPSYLQHLCWGVSVCCVVSVPKHHTLEAYKGCGGRKYFVAVWKCFCCQRIGSNCGLLCW